MQPFVLSRLIKTAQTETVQGQGFGGPHYINEKQKEEIRHLKLIVDRLSGKLAEY